MLKKINKTIENKNKIRHYSREFQLILPINKNKYFQTF